MAFFFEVLVTGLMVGIMYSLVALGFALIFKASEVFNMAQGAMSLFAALALYGFLEQYLQLPLWLALLCTVATMIIWAYAIVFIVLKPLVNRPPLMLFMATFGVAYLMEGIGQSIYGTQAKGLNLGIPDESYEIAGVFISSFDLFFALVAAILVAGLIWFFSENEERKGTQGRVRRP
jgi:branched-chain amino acid transport system permease protein